MVIIDCEWCGEEHTYLYKGGRKKKFCGKKCADRASHLRQSYKYSSNCLECGESFSSSNKEAMFCSYVCSYYGTSRQEKECESCGSVFIGGNNRRYCSIDCRREERVCPVCNDSFNVLPGYSTVYCSSHCYGNDKVKYESYCDNCGEMFKGKKNRANKFCSWECYYKKRTNGGFVRNYSTKVFVDSGLKRARKYNAKRETINVRKVFDNDNWLCGICGELVDKEIPYPDRESASVDHIVPLSKGGNHTYDNLQIAHLQCNLKKHNNTETVI